MNQFYRKPTRYHGHPVSVAVLIERGTVFECDRCGLVEEYPRSDFGSTDEWFIKYNQLKDKAMTHFTNKCVEVSFPLGAPKPLPLNYEQASIFDLLGV